MIICSRCGKENQDQFKYCLGCGLKLQTAVPAPAPAEPPTAPLAAQAPAGSAVARTASPPPPAAAVAEPPAPVAAAQDAPRPRVVTSAKDAAAESRLASAPTAWRPGGVQAAAASPAAPTPGAGSRASAASAQAPAKPTAQPSPVVPVPAPPAPIAVQAAYPLATAAPVPAAAQGPVVCPRCGQPVSAGFTFCGSCGHRMKSSAGAVVEAAVQQAAALAPEPVKVKVRGQLTLIRPDGAEGGSHPLQQGENLVGRGQGHLFDADPYLSPRHAEFVLSEGGLEVRDLRSLNGVFVKLTQEEPLESGDTFRIGQELLRFDVISPPSPLEDGTEIIGTPNPGYWGRLSVIVGRDVDGPAFPIFDEAIVLGRERGDILFPEDGYVSGTHAQITLRDGRVCLSDLGSSNGTFLRVRDLRAVPTGSLLLMGQQLFRVAYQ